MVKLRVGWFKLESHSVISMCLFELLLVEVDISFVEVVNSVLRVEFNSLFVLFYSLIHDDVILRTRPC